MIIQNIYVCKIIVMMRIWLKLIEYSGVKNNSVKQGYFFVYSNFLAANNKNLYFASKNLYFTQFTTFIHEKLVK